MKKEECRACGELWINHDGVEPTCRKLQECISTLKVIHTWAAFETEYCPDPVVFDPYNVVNLIEKTFDSIGEFYNGE